MKRRHKPRILADIDGFFANFIDASLPTIKAVVRDLREGGLTPEHEAISHDDVRSYRMEEVLDLTPNEIIAWHTRVKSPGYCAAIRPYDGAKKAIAQLQEIGDVHPVTFPWPGSPHWIIEREQWLAEELGIDPDLVVYTRQKHLVAGDFFLEDTTKYLVLWREHFPDGVAIRMQRPYNVNEPFSQGVTVKNFEELVHEVRTAAELREQHWQSLWNNI